MSLLGFLVLLLVAAVCGSVGAAIAGFSRPGCLANIAIGLIGAVIGSWLANQLHAPPFLVVARIPVFWAVIGAALFMAIIGAISRR
ncbi:MAG: GlsB/YeaQ/YmgE family stress response membrane protein [candidate division KSB1 bacterium]|nr:GlsB/YeaQ/YmgE family stress response membrane protein [candidate division KSB1 bacterium]MDZ7337168.1 GlsB/YeaQ/YmgE family stress response membrane protein [candidate division KSB1 bacterium]MDZ7385450.1 GlsB/YeaQ/YmgE family stress response membrane protein [candidate division KSB1 bacterium]MDZ7391819.1 GlsB/YeaQ/YmgE family stress response membrane protein [candidate division KSB1 bacterium]MDZ7413178.1 GlsB/YeaQ/YmgE family stress response membrane protein [candidate division KSB1 bact